MSTSVFYFVVAVIAILIKYLKHMENAEGIAL